MTAVPTPTRSSRRGFRLWPFLVWLMLFYGIWGALVLAGQHVDTLADHWAIALAMAAGAYVAGSTPMGGGTVGFPVLVLLQDLPATLGRDFSFAVQSIGMTSASIFILCRRQPLEWPMLRAAMLGSLAGTPLGIILLAPLVPDLFIKLLFAVVWGSFGLLHLRRIREITAHEGITPTNLRFDHVTGLLVGFLGGLTVAAVTGVGIDMLIYMVLVMLCHADLRIAIATSIVLMAFTSLVGMATKLMLGTVQPGVYENWLAAAPVVALAAPLGAFIVSRIGRRPTLLVVSGLCVMQLGWTLVHEWDALSAGILAAASVALALVLVGFEQLHRLGNRLARRQRLWPRSTGTLMSPEADAAS